MTLLLVYDPQSIHRDALCVFRNRGYEAIPLSNNPRSFWDAVARSDYTALVLYSHGNSDGPLLVAGNDGPSMNRTESARLFTILARNGASLYLLSCQTGNPPFRACLPPPLPGNVPYAAPLGYARIDTTASSLAIFSVDPSDPSKKVGWYGVLAPDRTSKQLILPSRL